MYSNFTIYFHLPVITDAEVIYHIILVLNFGKNNLK